MQPKLGYEVGDLILTSIFISLTVILISRLSLSYPLENLENKQIQTNGKLEQKPIFGGLGFNLESSEAECKSLAKRATWQGKIVKIKFSLNQKLNNLNLNVFL